MTRRDVLWDAILSIPVLLCLFATAYVWLVIGTALIGD